MTVIILPPMESWISNNVRWKRNSKFCPEINSTIYIWRASAHLPCMVAGASAFPGTCIQVLTAVIVIFNNEKSYILEVYGYQIEGERRVRLFYSLVWPVLGSQWISREAWSSYITILYLFHHRQSNSCWVTRKRMAPRIVLTRASR
jgi:hypothetical protein